MFLSPGRPDEIPSVFESNAHSKCLLDYAEKKRKEGVFNDVTIIAGDESIPGNKIVLSCYSKFFETMFETNMKERYENKVEVSGFDGQIIKMLVQYMYTGTITIDSSNVMNVLAAADYLQLDSVKDYCFDYMVSKLTPQNCLNIISASILFKPIALLTETYQVFSDNLEEISLSENFKALSKIDLFTIFEKLVSSEATEKAKHKALMNWINSDYDSRSKDFSDLFTLVDISQLSYAFLRDVVSAEPLVKQNTKCLSAVLECTLSELKETTLRETLPKILCVGGNKESIVFSLSDLLGKNNFVGRPTYPKLPIYYLSHHAVTKINDSILCIGGETAGGTDKETVFRMNLHKPSLAWKKVAPLKEATSYFGCAVLGGKVVIAGGRGNSDLVWLYNTELNEWTEMSSLNEGRDGNALVACEGSLYAIGGWKNSSVECLRILNGTWLKVASMQTHRNCLAAVTSCGCIYAIGGYSETAEKTMEKYNPNENTWVSAKAMNNRRSGHAACAVRDMIFVVGGQDENGEYVHDVECYNVTSDRWSVVGQTDVDLYGHTLVVI